MSTNWHTLFVRADDSAIVAAVLVAAYEQIGYQPFDPFPGGSGTPAGLKETVKHFVAPAQSGWVRVLGVPSLDLHLDLPYLHAWLTNTASSLDVYHDGIAVPDGLVPYLKSGYSLQDIQAALKGPIEASAHDNSGSALPAALDQLAKERGVNTDQAGQMFARISSQLVNRMDKQSGGEASQAQQAARSILSGKSAVNWTTVPAKRLERLMSLTTLPTNWREPDFDMLRDALQVARRLKLNPRASLLPDEGMALARVSKAIDYLPIYMGR